MDRRLPENEENKVVKRLRESSKANSMSKHRRCDEMQDPAHTATSHSKSTSKKKYKSFTFALLATKQQSSVPNLVFIKHIEDKRSKLGGISKRKELLVDLLEAHGVQLTARTVLNEAFVPDEADTHRKINP